MAFEYFSKLPVIDYPISQTQTKRGRDILHRFFVDQKYAKMNEYLMQYRAEDGDALDVISAKLYRRADYHSIIMFINPAKGVFGGGLPISSAVQEEYMDTLYGDTVHLLSHTVPPVVIYDWVPSGPTAPPEIKTKIDSARAEQYIIVYQSIDVPSQTTGVIDTSLAITSINEQIAQGKNPNGWGMLDYEKPFDTVLQNGPTDPLYTTCVNSMLSTLRAVKAAFPGIRWTYFGIPGLSYYPGAALWPFADEAARQAEIERQIRGYGPILRELDWYNPSAYDIWNQANIPPPPTPNQPDPAQVAVHERVYRMARVGVVKEFLRRNGLENRPILPAVSPFFAPGACGDPWPAVDPYTLSGGRIPQNQIYSDQIQPVLDAGADGVAIWSGKDYWTRLATSNNIPSSQDGYTAQQEARYAYTIDYFAGITPGSVSSTYAGWTAQATKATITQGVGNAIADMAVAAAGSTALQVGRDVYPIFGYGLEEGETVFSWFPGNPDQEVDTETAAVVGEWNARMMTVKLDQVKGSFPVGTILGNESKTALFRVTKKIQEKDAVHHFEATQDTFAGTPLKKGSIIDPLSAVYPVSGGVVLTPIGNPGICGGSTGSYFNSLVYLQNTIGIPPAISPYIKAVSNQEQEYRKMESNRTMNVPSNNPNLLEGLVRAVEDILDGVQ